MALKIGKINKVKSDLTSFPPYIVYGVPKSGKTTLFRDLVLHNYNTPESGLLISIADEEGYHSLDDLQVVVAKDWHSEFDEEEGTGGLADIVDYIVENNKELGLKMVCLDTYDKMTEIGTDEVLRQHKKEKGQACKSINDALGGYGAGRIRLKEIIREQISKLREAGVAVFLLSHCKIKEKTDLLTGQPYDQLTNNLSSDVWGTIADIAQIICAINIEKEIVDGKLVGSRRMMHFRDEGLIECGSRFNGIPDRLELSAENFMIAFNEGVKNSSKTRLTDEQLEEKRKQEVEESKSKVDKPKKIDTAKNKKLLEKITSSLDNIDFDKMQEIMAKFNVTSLKEVDTIPTACLEEITSLI